MAIKDDGPGLSFIEIENKIMNECSTVEEAVEVIESSPRFSAGKIHGKTCPSTVYLFAYAKGRIASMEASHRFFAVKRGKETGSIMAQANHYQWVVDLQTVMDTYTNSLLRCARMWNLLKENRGSERVQW